MPVLDVNQNNHSEVFLIYSWKVGLPNAQYSALGKFSNQSNKEKIPSLGEQIFFQMIWCFVQYEKEQAMENGKALTLSRGNIFCGKLHLLQL